VARGGLEPACGRSSQCHATLSQAIDVVAYASLVALFVVLATGLVEVLFGDAAVPRVARAYQVRFGWPGQELSPRGLRRAAALFFGGTLLVLDAVALVGVMATSMRDDRSTWVIQAAELSVAIMWSFALARGVLKVGRQTPGNASALSDGRERH